MSLARRCTRLSGRHLIGRRRPQPSRPLHAVTISTSNSNLKIGLAQQGPSTRPTFSRAKSTMSDNQKLPPFDAEPAHQLTQPPDPEWKLGQGMRVADRSKDGHEGGKPEEESPSASALRRAWETDAERGCRVFNLDELDKSAVYKLMTSAVVPRPVAFVSSLSKDGVPNLAPFSYFSLISHDPAMLTVAFTLSTQRPKDTRENILATGQFVVNIISEPFIEAANACSVEAPADIDEWKVSGLTPEPCEVVKPPRVRESAVSFECELYTHIDIPRTADLPPLSSSAPPSSMDVKPGQEPGTTLVVARVRRLHVRRAVLMGAPPAASSLLSPSEAEHDREQDSGSAEKIMDGKPGIDEEAAEPFEVDPFRLRAVSRMGSVRFARVGAGFDILRPRWRDVESEVDRLGARVGERKGGDKEK